MAHEFCGDELRCRLMARENVEHLQTVIETAARGNLVTEHDLLAVIVCSRVEEKRTRNPARGLASQRVYSRRAATRLKDGPTCKATRNFLHVFLRVTTVDTERVQFHQLARVVFVDTAARLLKRRVHHHLRTAAARIRTHALKVVEIKQHRRTLRGRL